MIKKCSCKHEFQDKQYGDKMRVHNKCKGVRTNIAWRCTVCGNKKEK